MLLFKKFFWVTIVIGTLPEIAQTAERTFGILPTMIVIVLMLITILPELLLIFPGYRKMIVMGIQDGDKIMKRDDLKYFISWYGPFSILRVIVFFSLFSMVEPWQPSSEIIWALVAVGTGTALPQLKLIFGKKSN